MTALENVREHLPRLLLLYLAAVNLLTFAAFGMDKRKAKRGAYRISEAALLGLSCVLCGY